MPTEQQLQECRKLNRLYKIRVAGQISKGDKPLEQADIANTLGVTQSRVSQILTGFSAINLERAIIFAQHIRCEVAEFSPRLAALAQGIPVLRVTDQDITVVVGTHKEITTLVRKMAAGTLSGAKATFDHISFPAPHSANTFCFKIASDAMAPSLRAGVLAVVDCDVSPEPGDDAALLRQEKLTFARWMGEGHCELVNPKFKNSVFQLTKKDAVIGKVIGVIDIR
jgi:transcriptional regulator with XRE-family HTH domain